jgi:hypothetical protein
MTRRIYWVSHTLCALGRAHCHNDSSSLGQRTSRDPIHRIIAHLPGPESRYHLEEVLVGGGEALVRGAETEYLIRTFRARYPRGPQATVAERRAAGSVILALQTSGLPLADRRGRVRGAQVECCLRQGVDYFQVASSDTFHRRQKPGFPWQVLEDGLAAYRAAHGVEFRIYGKGINRLVPSGRVLGH